MPQDVYQHTFPNGLTLLAERMEHVRSAALNVLVPAGCVYDPPGPTRPRGHARRPDHPRGGDRDSRELTLALDNLGLDRSESVGSLHTRFYGATLARNLPAALEIYADILRRPHFARRRNGRCPLARLAGLAGPGGRAAAKGPDRVAETPSPGPAVQRPPRDASRASRR